MFTIILHKVYFTLAKCFIFILEAWSRLRGDKNTDGSVGEVRLRGGQEQCLTHSIREIRGALPIFFIMRTVQKDGGTATGLKC